MKAAAFAGPRKFELKDLDQPVPGPGEASAILALPRNTRPWKGATPSTTSAVKDTSSEYTEETRPPLGASALDGRGWPAILIRL